MTYNDTFIRACRKQAVDHIPVWYMRHTGRYDPEYRKIKEKYTLLEICRQPELKRRSDFDARAQARGGRCNFIF